MAPSNDREDRIDALKKLEHKLTNGARGNVEVMSDCIVELARAVCLMLNTDFVKPEELIEFFNVKHSKRFGWPAATVIITIVISAVGLVVRFTT